MKKTTKPKTTGIPKGMMIVSRKQFKEIESGLMLIDRTVDKLLKITGQIYWQTENPKRKSE